MSQDADDLLSELKKAAARLGYRFEVSADGREERLIRPDGTVAVIARKPQDDKDTSA